MSKRFKLIQRFKSKPADFSWDELVNLLSGFNYYLIPSGKTGGSRVKFANENQQVIFLHKPHPSQVLKRYQIDYIYDFLNNEKLI